MQMTLAFLSSHIFLSALLQMLSFYTFLLDPVAPDRPPVRLPSHDPQAHLLSSVCLILG